jgi:hypothetical protein
MPSGWVLVDILTRKIKLRCIKNTVLGTLPLWNGKDPDPFKQLDPDPYRKDDIKLFYIFFHPQILLGTEFCFKNTFRGRCYTQNG